MRQPQAPFCGCRRQLMQRGKRGEPCTALPHDIFGYLGGGYPSFKHVFGIAQTRRIVTRLHAHTGIPMMERSKAARSQDIEISKYHHINKAR